jgi:hypothetical protein
MSMSSPEGATPPTDQAEAEPGTSAAAEEPLRSTEEMAAVIELHRATFKLHEQLGVIRARMALAIGDQNSQGMVEACRALIAFTLEAQRIADNLEPLAR